MPLIVLVIVSAHLALSVLSRLFHSSCSRLCKIVGLPMLSGVLIAAMLAMACRLPSGQRYLGFMGIMSLLSLVCLQTVPAMAMDLDLDTTSTVSKGQWYDASTEKEHWIQYVKSFATCGDCHCLDAFSGRGAIGKKWRQLGFRTCNYEIKTDQSADCSTRAGFEHLIHLSMRLVGPGSIIVAGPPCSMFTFWSSSQHRRRDWRLYGDVNDPATALSNIIAVNFITFLEIFHFARPGQMPFVVLEQPQGSWMYKLPEYTAAFGLLGLVAVSTFMGCFGHVLEKPTKLMVNWAGGMKMSRKMTPKIKEKVKRRQEKSGKVFYVKTPDGRVHGTKHLKETASYTAWFAQALFRLWLAEWNQLKS